MPLNIDFQQILLHLLNFVILFARLYFFLYGPVKKFMDDRTEQYKRMDEKARKDAEDAASAKSEYETRLAEVGKEIDKEKKAARRSIAEQTEKSLYAAKREAERIIDQANKKAETDRERIIEQAGEDIADMVADATEKLVLKSSASESYDSFLEAALGGERNE